MAIAFTNLGASTGTAVNPDLLDNVDRTSYTNTSWTPPTSGIVVAFVLSAKAAADSSVDAFTHNGVAFTRVGTDLTFNTATRRISMFASYGSILSSGITTVDFGTDLQLACHISFFYIIGADESAAVTNAFIPATGTSGVGTSGSVTLSAGLSSSSRTLAAIAHTANEAVAGGANFIPIDSLNGASPSLGWITEYSSTFQTTADASWTTSTDWGGFAVEIKDGGLSALGDNPPIGFLGKGAGW